MSSSTNVAHDRCFRQKMLHDYFAEILQPYKGSDYIVLYAKWQTVTETCKNISAECFLCNFLWKDMSVKQLGATPLSRNKGKTLLCDLWQQLWQRLLSHTAHTSVCVSAPI